MKRKKNGPDHQDDAKLRNDDEYLTCIWMGALLSDGLGLLVDVVRVCGAIFQFGDAQL